MWMVIYYNINVSGLFTVHIKKKVQSLTYQKLILENKCLYEHVSHV